jgi:hypothetical protein
MNKNKILDHHPQEEVKKSLHNKKKKENSTSNKPFTPFITSPESS